MDLPLQELCGVMPWPYCRDGPTCLLLRVPWPQPRRERWDHFHHFDVSLHCDDSKSEMKNNLVKTPTPMRPTSAPFITPAETSPPEGVSNLSFMQKCYAKIGPLTLPTGDDHSGRLCWATATRTASSKPGELPLGGVLLTNSSTPSFVSPILPDIWQCVKASWQQPLKAKAPVLWISSGCWAARRYLAPACPHSTRPSRPTYCLSIWMVCEQEATAA